MGEQTKPEKEEERVKKLIKALKGEDWWLRWVVTWVLGEIGEQAKEEVVSALKVAMVTDDEPRVRERAVIALEQIKCETWLSQSQ